MPKVLFIESNTLLNEIMSQWIEAYDFEIKSAHSAQEAKSLLNNFKFDIIVSNLFYSDGNYKDIFISLNHKVPFVILTIAPLDDQIKELNDLGIKHIFTMPLMNDHTRLFMQTLQNEITKSKIVRNKPDQQQC